MGPTASSVRWFALINVVVSIVQAVASLAVVATFFIYRRQLSAMQAQISTAQQTAAEQISASRRIGHAQAALALADFLHSVDVYAARSHLLSYLAVLPYERWTNDDKTLARRAIGAYDIAAILGRMDALPVEVIARNWGASIIKCEKAARGMIEDLRNEHGHLWWDDFLALVAYSRGIWQTVADRYR